MSRETPFDRSFDETRRHLELAERFLVDGKELIDEDPAQAVTGLKCFVNNCKYF